ncbi:MAG: hypothetical protein QNJ91_14990, partial [Gammaproteobacteria bacterium]|nr:hypothetical protein [Gammaproteobacteria bacterium]
MDDVIVWLIIAAFYAPLHFLLPALLLFVTGRESEATRRRIERGDDQPDDDVVHAPGPVVASPVT